MSQCVDLRAGDIKMQSEEDRRGEDKRGESNLKKKKKMKVSTITVMIPALL